MPFEGFLHPASRIENGCDLISFGTEKPVAVKNPDAVVIVKAMNDIAVEVRDEI